MKLRTKWTVTRTEGDGSIVYTNEVTLWRCIVAVPIVAAVVASWVFAAAYRGWGRICTAAFIAVSMLAFGVGGVHAVLVVGAIVLPLWLGLGFAMGSDDYIDEFRPSND
ncbi:hypothetical protein [Nocardia sp. NPDC057227]|uniref:hypothetical protein n=1 Tax=Nocardia sp. NPDC057227 TaxID=3346056 RepID=UPI00363A4D26